MKLGPLFADILVADGDPAFVRAVRVVLQSAGYTVRSVASGEATLEAIQHSPPDLVVLDAQLPGTDGYTMTRQLKADASLPFVPILITADDPDRTHLAAALNAGADEFIAKPVDNTELLTRVRAMLRLKNATDALADLNATLEQKVVERTRQLEESHAQLRHAEKLSSLGRLAASLAHEINNPLTGILNYIYLIKRDLPADSTVQEDIAVIEQQVRAIAKLVQELRDFSKPPRRKRMPINLDQVLEDVLLLTGKELQKHHIQVILEQAPDLPPVQASPEQMAQVFMNLILNAQDAMPGGGTLTIRTTTDGAWVQGQVVDTGIGIPEDVMGRIFEPFFTTKGEHGTGLGLSICYSIVQDHGGQIGVESREGEGTRFTIQLPICSTES